jgi:hypothetical protein
VTGEVPYDGESFVAIAMRHVNDPVPSVRETRPDVSPRLDRAIRRAMAKDHAERFGSMAEFAGELEACLAELSGEEGATMVVPPAARPGRPRRRPQRSRRRWSIWPAVLLGVGLAALAGGLVAAVLLHDNGKGSNGSPPRPLGPVHFTSAAAFDPDGDGHEHDASARDAIDANTSTAWETEHYNGAQLNKAGVGIVVGAARPVRPKRLTITTDTPGFTAVVKTGDSATGPFHVVSRSTTVAGTEQTFDLSGGGRYFLLWITDLGSNEQVRIDEISAR